MHFSTVSEFLWYVCVFLHSLNHGMMTCCIKKILHASLILLVIALPSTRLGYVLRTLRGMLSLLKIQCLQN